MKTGSRVLQKQGFLSPMLPCKYSVIMEDHRLVKWILSRDESTQDLDKSEKHLQCSSFDPNSLDSQNPGANEKFKE